MLTARHLGPHRPGAVVDRVQFMDDPLLVDDGVEIGRMSWYSTTVLGSRTLVKYRCNTKAEQHYRRI